MGGFLGLGFGERRRIARNEARAPRAAAEIETRARSRVAICDS